MKIAIIGGAGRMGQWLARFLTSQGEEVTIIDRDKDRLAALSSRLGVRTSSDMGAVAGAKIILLAVPIDSFEAVARELAHHVKSEQLVLDITSVKAMPVEVMHCYLAHCRVLGTHPVFGPGAHSLKGHTVVLTPTNSEESQLAEKVKAYLEARGAGVRIMTPEEHDETMAVVLGLAHFVAIVAGDSLLSLDRLPEMEASSGVTFKALLALVESVLGEDPSLYAAIQMHLPGLPCLEEDFQKRAAEWAELVEKKDSAAFVQRMTALRQRLSELNLDTNQAYSRLYRLTETGRD